MQQTFPANKDAFSNGQIDSKLWLCRELEALNLPSKQKIWILGGWQGLAAFLLLSRDQFPVKHIRSFDVDPGCEAIADLINENWVYKEWTFKAFTKDANLLDYNTNERPDIVINTSCEHFDSMDWFHKIPKGTLVALQSNNLQHDEDTNSVNNIAEMILKYQLTDLIYDGILEFKYPNMQFTRFMIIGIK